jgi:hypothetical protein
MVDVDSHLKAKFETAEPSFLNHAEAVSVIALSVAGAFLGVSASKLPQGLEGGLVVGATILFLSLLHSGNIRMARAWYYRQWGMGFLLSFVTLCLAVLLGGLLGIVADNVGIGLGITIGWWITTILPLVRLEARLAEQLRKNDD